MSPQTSTRKLTLADIADVRAYERERDEFRASVMETKRRRRLSFGTIITLMFENRDTMRLQIQEMARVEKLVTDEEIQVELDTYNPMIPEPGQLVRHGVPRAHERRPDARVAAEAGRHRALVRRRAAQRRSGPLDRRRGPRRANSPVKKRQRRCTTSASSSRPNRSSRSRRGSVRIEIEHPDYLEAVELSESTHAELLGDLRG